MLTAVMLAAGCETTTATRGGKAVCAVWQPISWADDDTDQTIREVKANNAARDAFCGD